jgi:hypothetical protein
VEGDLMNSQEKLIHYIELAEEIAITRARLGDLESRLRSLKIKFDFLEGQFVFPMDPLGPQYLVTVFEHRLSEVSPLIPLSEALPAVGEAIA